MVKPGNSFLFLNLSRLYSTALSSPLSPERHRSRTGPLLCVILKTDLLIKYYPVLFNWHLRDRCISISVIASHPQLLNIWNVMLRSTNRAVESWMVNKEADVREVKLSTAAPDHKPQCFQCVAI